MLTILACIVPLIYASMLTMLTILLVLVSLQVKQLAGYNEWWPFSWASIQALGTTLAAMGVERGSHSEGSLSPIDWPTSFR